jgi:hypothetical protein
VPKRTEVSFLLAYAGFNNNASRESKMFIIIAAIALTAMFTLHVQHTASF